MIGEKTTRRWDSGKGSGIRAGGCCRYYYHCYYYEFVSRQGDGDNCGHWMRRILPPPSSDESSLRNICSLYLFVYFIHRLSDCIGP